MGALLGDDVDLRRGRRPRVQAARPVAHVLERRRRALPDPRDHRPAGFEHFFGEMGDAGAGRGARHRGLRRRYAIEFDLESVPRLCAEHDLTHPLLTTE